MKIGIVGLPNVGKSTLFNALTKSASAEAANYPFCTIDPNVGIVEVPDERMARLAEMAKPERVIPAIVEFVDIAGLVKGASQGEGLGNKFLANIREVDAIGQVLRVFEDGDIVHVNGNVDPKRDKEIIETELILADLETVEKRLGKAGAEAKSGDKLKVAYRDFLGKIKERLEGGQKVSEMELSEEERELLKDLHLLTAKPFIYILNVKDDELAGLDLEEIRGKLGLAAGERLVPISAKVEEEMIGFSEEEAREFLQDLGLGERGLDLLIREAYEALGLMTFFTAGVKEVRAWTIKKGWKAPQAAGVIHTDFESNFIRAEVIAYDDYVTSGGESQAREKGKMRSEGKEYIVVDGDVMLFRHSA